MEHSFRHTVIFTTLLCVVCSVLVSAVAVSLRERQQYNQLLDRKKNVLAVAGLMEPGERLASEEIDRRFEANLEARVVDLESGDLLEDVDPETFDQRKAAKNPETSRAAPENPAKVRRIPDMAVIYLVRGEGERIEGLILPVEGMGLWSTLYGFIALETRRSHHPRPHLLPAQRDPGTGR